MSVKFYSLFITFLLITLVCKAQDKLFFKNGTSVKCKIVAISESTISYRDTIPSAQLVTVPKKDVLLAEYRTGEVYIFGSASPNQFQVVNGINESREQRRERKMKEWKDKEANLSNNILGFYIPELLFGRLTVSYERLFNGKSMGVKVPVSLTYNPFGAMESTNSSSTNTNTSNNNNSGGFGQQKGVNFITGLDINYYHDLKPELKYFFGPRIRYGTDMALGGIEGLSVQLQNGIFRSRGTKFTSTIGVGFGFFKLSEKYSQYPGYEPKQVYPWASFTWRMGFRL